MEDAFELPVVSNGIELLFPAKLIQFGYSYRIDIDANGTVFSFEKDDDGCWRGMVQPDQVTNTKIDRELLQNIVAALDSHF